MSLQLKAFDVSCEALGAAVLACAAGQWCQLVADLPEGAEFVQLVPLPGAEQETLRLFFYHESFPESKTAEKVEAVPVAIKIAEEVPA